jgi:hypothetical protein
MSSLPVVPPVPELSSGGMATPTSSIATPATILGSPEGIDPKPRLLRALTMVRTKTRMI